MYYDDDDVYDDLCTFRSFYYTTCSLTGQLLTSLFRACFFSNKRSLAHKCGRLMSIMTRFIEMDGWMKINIDEWTNDGQLMDVYIQQMKFYIINLFYIL